MRADESSYLVFILVLIITEYLSMIVYLGMIMLKYGR